MVISGQVLVSRPWGWPAVDHWLGAEGALQLTATKKLTSANNHANLEGYLSRVKLADENPVPTDT